MVRITCEMCGSNNLIKQDGEYVCQHCGTKYSIEEAKKLMVEVTGTVDISGSTVKVDNTSFIQKSLENARRAKSKEDWEECEKYYNLVEQNDPKNIEAIFYSAYGKAKMAMLEADKFKREQIVNVLKNSISIIDDNYDSKYTKYEENKALILAMNEDILNLIGGRFVYNVKTSNGFTVSSDSSYTYSMFEGLMLAWNESLTNIIYKIGESKTESLYLYHLIIDNTKTVLSLPSTSNWTSEKRNQYRKIIYDYVEIIKKIDPSDNNIVIEQKFRWISPEENKKENKKLAIILSLSIGIPLALLGLSALSMFIR